MCFFLIGHTTAHKGAFSPGSWLEPGLKGWGGLSGGCYLGEPGLKVYDTSIYSPSVPRLSLLSSNLRCISGGDQEGKSLSGRSFSKMSQMPVLDIFERLARGNSSGKQAPVAQ